MSASKCAGGAHVWHVGEKDGKLVTKTLGHGHRCQCGARVIAMVECQFDGRHKRVLSRKDFDKLMEDTHQ